MAQIIFPKQYYEGCHLTEGPFAVADFRHHYSVVFFKRPCFSYFLDITVSMMLFQEKMKEIGTQDEIQKSANFLNQKVADGIIVKKENIVIGQSWLENNWVVQTR